MVHSLRRQPGRLVKTVFGFYPYWMESSGSEVRDDFLSQFCYFGCEVDPETGMPADLHEWNSLSLIDSMRQQGVGIILAAFNFGMERNRAFLSRPAAKERLIDTLIALCAARGGRGVNIDFEIVPGGLRDSLTQFMARLGSRLRERIPGAQLSIDLPAADRGNAFDAARLSDFCDRLIVMGYDFHHAGSSVAGPVAPLESDGLRWKGHVRAAVESLIGEGAEPEKILLGIPLYGYEWLTDADTLGARVLRTGKARFYSSIRTDPMYDARRRDTLSGAAWSVARAGSAWRQVWFDDSVSLAQKYRFADSAGLGGIALWALGYEGRRPEIGDGILDAFLRVERIDFESPFPLDAAAFFASSSGISRTSRLRIRKLGEGNCLELLLRDSLASIRPWQVRVPLANLLPLPRQGCVRLLMQCRAASPGLEIACLVRRRGRIYSTAAQPVARKRGWVEYLIPLSTLPDSILPAAGEDRLDELTLDGFAIDAPGGETPAHLLFDNISALAISPSPDSRAGELRLESGAVTLAPRLSGGEIAAAAFQRFDPAAGSWSTIAFRRIPRSQREEERFVHAPSLPTVAWYRLLVTDRAGNQYPLGQWRLDLRPKVLSSVRTGGASGVLLALDIRIPGVYAVELISPAGRILAFTPNREMEAGMREIFLPGRDLEREPDGVYFALVQSGGTRAASRFLLMH